MTDTGAPTATDTDRGARRLAAWLLPALALAQVALLLGADLAVREQSRVCIADQLPDGFQLTALTARDGTLVAELRAPHVRLGALSFDRLGSCV